MIHFGRISVLMLLVLTLFGCGNRRANNNGSKIDSYWDHTAQNYHIPQLGLVYHVQNPDNVIIAPPTDLPEDILMCVIDTVTYDCITVLNLDSENLCDNYSMYNLENYVRKIVEQSPSVESEIIDSELTPTEFMGENAWRFNAEINIVAAPDTTCVSYAGYIFYRNNTPKAIVLTTKHIPDLTRKLDLYISAFSKME